MPNPETPCSQHASDIAVLMADSKRHESNQKLIFDKLDSIKDSVSEMKSYVKEEFGQIKGATKMATALWGSLGVIVGLVVDFLASPFKPHS